MKQDEVKRLEEMARRIRRTAIELAHDAGSHGSHLGGSLSCVEIYAVLYGAVLNIRPDNPAWDGRDRMIVGKEHARLAEYPAMAEAGLIRQEDLSSYLQDGGLLAGHPKNPDIGLEYSSCSLGMAFPVAVGMALDARRKAKKHKIYTIMGDGEMNEGSMWEAFMAASHFKLDNLVAVIDRNHLSADGDTEEIMALGNIKEKLEAFGWNCREVENGNDVGQLLEAFREYQTGRPYAVIAETVKGKGVSFAENVPRWHRDIMTDKLYQIAVSEQGEQTDAD